MREVNKGIDAMCSGRIAGAEGNPFFWLWLSTRLMLALTARRLSFSRRRAKTCQWGSKGLQ